METRFLQRNIFQRIFGIPVTRKPQDPGCWAYSDGKLTIDLNRAPELKKPGNAIRIEGENLPQRVLVVSDETGKFHAFQNRCTHLGHRRLDFVPNTNTVQCCSVSKSTYGFDGEKTFGPAPDPIITYPIDTDGDNLFITIT